MRRPIAAVVVLILVVLATGSIDAQTNSWRVTTPSPTAASLGKFGDIPVSLYTGIPDITVPLFTAKGRTLELPIALKYHAGGIKVEEIGSWVGIGWTLEAGGTITRTVRGLLDEDLGRGYYYTGNTWYDPMNWPTPDVSVMQSLFHNLVDELIDGEPDQFFFNFAGRTGQFVMGRPSGTGPVEVRTIPHQKLRVEPSFADNSISGWTITTEDGTQYGFGAAETTTDWTTTTSTAEDSHWGQSYTSSWHLTSIASPGGDAITLNYQSYSARHRQITSREKFDYVQVPEGEACVQPWFDVFPDNAIASARLETITTAAHTVTFTTSARTDDQPVTGSEPRLDRITVSTAGGTVLRAFQFGYDYSTGRLTLTSVAEQDRFGASLPPYTFEYGGPALPSRFSMAMDHWGFYNGKTSNTTLVPMMIGPFGSMLSGGDRSPDPAFARAAILRKITYPTGGFSEFVYEPNDYGSVAGAPIVAYVDGDEQGAEAFAGPNAEVIEQQFTLTTPEPNGKILVTLDFFQDPIGCAQLDDPPCPMTELVGVGGWQVEGQYQVLLSPGTYTLRATTLVWNQQAVIRATWRNKVVSLGRIGAGTRVAEVRSSDAMNPPTVTIRRYKYTLASDPARSSGVVSAEPRYHYWYYSPYCTYFSRTSRSRMPLGDGPVVGYREVTVWHGENGEFGKTRHRFRSTADIADSPPETEMWPFSRRTSYEWMRGQETEATELNATGQTQRRTASTFAFPTDPVTYRSFRGFSVNSFSAGRPGTNFVTTGTNYVYSPFEVISAWTYQDSDTAVMYDEAGSNAISTARTYMHDNPNHLQLTQLTETNSDGTKRITRMKYPADYTSGSPPPGSEADALRLMQGEQHIHSPVVEQWVIQLNGSSARVVQAEMTTFKEFTTGKVLPYRHFILNAPSPLP